MLRRLDEQGNRDPAIWQGLVEMGLTGLLVSYSGLPRKAIPGQVEQGVIDPTKVTRTALTNAASIAGLMLTTECAISVIPEDTKPAQPGAGMDMM